MLYNVVLAPTVQQSESVICIYVCVHTHIYIIYISSFSDFLPIKVTTEQPVEFRVLYSRFSLIIYFICSITSVYIYIDFYFVIPCWGLF